MRVTYDREANAAYIELVEIPDGGVARTIELDRTLPGLLADLDAEGRLIGIEVLGAESNLPPELLATVEDITAADAELRRSRPGPRKPLPVRFCPGCASENLHLRMVYGPDGDGLHTHCHACGWCGEVLPEAMKHGAPDWR